MATDRTGPIDEMWNALLCLSLVMPKNLAEDVWKTVKAGVDAIEDSAREKERERLERIHTECVHELRGYIRELQDKLARAQYRVGGGGGW